MRGKGNCPRARTAGKGLRARLEAGHGLGRAASNPDPGTAAETNPRGSGGAAEGAGPERRGGEERGGHAAVGKEPSLSAALTAARLRPRRRRRLRGAVPGSLPEPRGRFTAAVRVRAAVAVRARAAPGRRHLASAGHAGRCGAAAVHAGSCSAAAEHPGGRSPTRPPPVAEFPKPILVLISCWRMWFMSLGPW